MRGWKIRLIRSRSLWNCLEPDSATATLLQILGPGSRCWLMWSTRPAVLPISWHPLARWSTAAGKFQLFRTPTWQIVEFLWSSWCVKLSKTWKVVWRPAWVMSRFGFSGSFSAPCEYRRGFGAQGHPAPRVSNVIFLEQRAIWRTLWVSHVFGSESLVSNKKSFMLNNPSEENKAAILENLRTLAVDHGDNLRKFVSGCI